MKVFYLNIETLKQISDPTAPQNPKTPKPQNPLVGFMILK